MELRHLRYFVALAEQRHFGRAATSLNMAQPPLSQQIRVLEEELNVKLFDRSVRPIELTQAGRVLLLEARQILAQAERAQVLTKRVGASGGAPFTIGITGSAALEFAPPVIAAFIDRVPEARLSLREMSSPAQIAALKGGEIDIGFVRGPVTDEEISIQLIYQEPYMIAMPASHPRAHARAPRLSDLNGSALVVFDSQEAPGFRESILQLCCAGNYQPTAIQSAYQMTTIMCLVASGLGIALVPRSARRIETEGVVFHSVQEDHPPVDLFAAWRKTDNAPYLEDLLAAIHQTQVRGAPND